MATTERNTEKKSEEIKKSDENEHITAEDNPSEVEEIIDYTQTPEFHSVIIKLRGNVINGMAILGDELFIANCDVVETYDLGSLKHTGRWDPEAFKGVYDVTQCRRNTCLYLMIKKLIHEIIRADPRGIVIKRWPIPDSGTLSATPEGNVLLTVDEQNKLYEYTSDGILVHTISLNLHNNDLKHPLHAIKLTSGSFLISHGKGADQFRRVCILDTLGVGNRDICSREMFSIPGYLSLDSNGNILVADHGRAEVVVLAPDLKIIKSYLRKSTHSVKLPIKLIIDEVNNRLFVIEESFTKFCLSGSPPDYCIVAVYALTKKTKK